MKNIVKGEIFGLGFILIQINHDNEDLFVISLPNIRLVICPNGSLLKNSLGFFVPLIDKPVFASCVNTMFELEYFKNFNLNNRPSEWVILEPNDSKKQVEHMYLTYLRKLKLELIDEN